MELRNVKLKVFNPWKISVTTEKEPAGIKSLNKAIKRDDAVKVRLIMMNEKVNFLLWEFKHEEYRISLHF